MIRKFLAAPFYGIAGILVIVGMGIGWIAEQIKGGEPAHPPLWDEAP